MEKLKTYSKLTSTPEALWAGGAFVLTQDTLGAITKIPSLTEADIPNDAIEAFNLSILDALTAAFQKQKVPIAPNSVLFVVVFADWADELCRL